MIILGRGGRLILLSTIGNTCQSFAVIPRGQDGTQVLFYFLLNRTCLYIWEEFRQSENFQCEQGGKQNVRNLSEVCSNWTGIVWIVFYLGLVPSGVRSLKSRSFQTFFWVTPKRITILQIYLYLFIVYFFFREEGPENH